MENKDKTEDNTNIKLIYEYTESYLKVIEESLKSLNTKCAGLVGFSGALLKPFFELPHCVNYESARVAALFLILTAAFCGIIGLLANPSGSVILPKYIWDEYYFTEIATDTELRGRIVTAWIESSDQLTKKAIFKGQLFNVGAVCFAFAILLSAVSALPSLVEAAPELICTKP